MSSLPSVDRNKSTLLQTTHNPSQRTEVFNVRNDENSSAEEISAEASLNSTDKQVTVEPALTTQATPASTSKENESQVWTFGSTGDPSAAHTPTGHTTGQSTTDSDSPFTTTTVTTQLNIATTERKMDPEFTSVKTTSRTTDGQIASKHGSSDTTGGKTTTNSKASTDSNTAGIPTTTVLSTTSTSTMERVSLTTHKDPNGATMTKSLDSETTLPSDVQSTVAHASRLITVDTTTGDFTTAKNNSRAHQ